MSSLPRTTVAWHKKTDLSVVQICSAQNLNKGCCINTLFLEHEVGFLDLRFFFKPQRPAVENLSHSVFNFLGRPRPEVLLTKEHTCLISVFYITLLLSLWICLFQYICLFLFFKHRFIRYNFPSNNINIIFIKWGGDSLISWFHKSKKWI